MGEDQSHGNSRPTVVDVPDLGFKAGTWIWRLQALLLGARLGQARGLVRDKTGRQDQESIHPPREEAEAVQESAKLSPAFVHLGAKPR